MGSKQWVEPDVGINICQQSREGKGWAGFRLHPEAKGDKSRNPATTKVQSSCRRQGQRQDCFQITVNPITSQNCFVISTSPPHTDCPRLGSSEEVNCGRISLGSHISVEFGNKFCGRKGGHCLHCDAAGILFCHFIVTNISQPSYASSKLWSRALGSQSCRLLGAFPCQAISFAHRLHIHPQIAL